MTLRNVTFDNSVNYNSKDKNSQSNFKPKTISLPKKQNNELSQYNKKFIKEYITAEGFGLPKGILNCYFWLLNILIR